MWQDWLKHAETGFSVSRLGPITCYCFDFFTPQFIFCQPFAELVSHNKHIFTYGMSSARWGEEERARKGKGYILETVLNAGILKGKFTKWIS